MSEAEKPQQQAPVRGGKGRKAWLLGLGLALPAGAGGFYITYTEPWQRLSAESSAAEPGGGAPAMNAQVHAYVALEPIMINLGTSGQSRLLRFVAHLEVAPRHVAEVERLMPRIIDVLNTYLRALELHEIEEPAALLRLRAQMLRRVQIVVGDGRVNDLLVTEFIVN